MKFFSLGSSSGDKTPRTGERRTSEDDSRQGGPDRRAGADRRGLTYGLKFKTGRAVGPIEDWLEDNFPGEYRLTIEGMSDDLHTKEIRVVFADDDQRVTFKAFLTTSR